MMNGDGRNSERSHDVEHNASLSALESPFGEFQKSFGPVQVRLYVYRGKNYFKLIVAGIASFLRLDQPMMEFPKG